MIKLLVDIGNRRIKWATSEQLTNRAGSDGYGGRGERIMSQVIHTHTRNLRRQLSEQFALLPVPDSVWVACVSGGMFEREMTGVCESLWGLSPVCARTGASNSGIKNCYEDPASLGVDRWVAVISGRHFAGKGPLLIIDAGTAVTIDYVNADDEFLGGVIFPGLTTMIDSLNSTTGLIREDIRPVDSKGIEYACTNTKSGVTNGAVLSVVAGIEKAIDHYLSVEGDKLKVIITGGDAEIISEISGHQMVVEPDLVLAGLALLDGSPAE